jgi:GNAT superfamily N-acetyltransferase
VKIRRIVATDWTSFKDLRLRALKHDPLAFGSTFLRERAYRPERWRDWAESGAAGVESATFVAEGAARRLVGMAGVFTDGSQYHVWGMWVSPEQRGRGLGGKLLDRILAWARSAHPDRAVYLDVNPVQSVAVRLYESRGFDSTGKTSPLGHHAPGIVLEMRRKPPSRVARKPSGRIRPAERA